MDFERSALPGIGLLHVLTTRRGRRMGVISHRTGRRDIVLYDEDDPDSTHATIALDVDEADAVAELLAASHIVERLAELDQQVSGLVSERIRVLPGSPYDGATLGDTRTRTRTGASIVAVVRDREVLASPDPAFRFAAEDVVVVIGTAEGTAAVARIFADG
ncbi:cation:proton antiporter regulatory subunit [Allonocardiopsis opalescens]|uniref:Potassium/proton antiporter regulatory subunit (CPA2 family) n=1 Tax=Allonocardiopsis opalescens TaxID=1144618 RepID=A0A2T0PX77_9ACTN|nr:cation:proton antiporter regulatory subunit [Allonocardiopsis opalescens]PRX96144.1 potassium/proton antiporter regulatory subunit (CPA2 family) [Allonocardiopsis opalescens]